MGQDEVQNIPRKGRQQEGQIFNPSPFSFVLSSSPIGSVEVAVTARAEHTCYLKPPKRNESRMPVTLLRMRRLKDVFLSKISTGMRVVAYDHSDALSAFRRARRSKTGRPSPQFLQVRIAFLFFPHLLVFCNICWLWGKKDFVLISEGPFAAKSCPK